MYKILKMVENDGELKDFVDILFQYYKNKEINLSDGKLKQYGIVREIDELLIYDKKGPLYISLHDFNEIPLFRTELEAISYLKSMNITPETSYYELSDFEKEVLTDKLLQKAKNLVPIGYRKIVEDVLLGSDYWLTNKNGEKIHLCKYVAYLNSLAKMGKLKEVEYALVNKTMENHMENLMEYRLLLAKSISIFDDMLDNNVKYANIDYKFLGKRRRHEEYSMLCQYVHLNKNFSENMMSKLGLNNNSLLRKYYPVLVHTAYTNPNISYLMPFFIFDGVENISVYAKIPKLLKIKYNLDFKGMDLTGNNTYFGNWSKRQLKSYLRPGERV
ncbi:hypothetical protein [Methanococcus voltae]|uniref:Uncharacterized protein n=1 Tax=Methanococcus voltae TaxID=2188 RepID=A0A8J7RI81_METVO|nr:hypothetical protein [Methanococcus voltae]MBP2173004.1 hypothetical protein [Methanococcus voltae]MBP2201940.1 hypothetical protein [Methanococcus voltae]